MNVAEKIYEHVKALPAPTAQEILDFVEFIENRRSQSKTNGDAIGTAGNRWPDIILAFEGVPDMPPFEQDRVHLRPPSEDPLT
jgi:hypothetical protein